MKTLFMTGYPGFLASHLIRELMNDHIENISHIYLLVLPTEREKAEQEINAYTKTANISKDIFTIVEGDITKKRIGLTNEFHHKIRNEVTHVFHLAAIYDLAVPKEIAERVNVHGTRCVNEWVQDLSNLKRYIYFSTAYVSGTREGRIYEHELSKGQSFRNHYERTKYEAELLVHQIKTKVPTTIIRPGIVRGHSKTGETIKFDGIYFMLNFYDKLRWLPIIPYLKDGIAYPEGNFVSSDYVLQATSYLSMHPVGEGKTYHLTDPNPYTMKQIQKMLCKYYLGRKPKREMPIAIAKALMNIPYIRKWLRVEIEAMDYFTFHSSYDAQEAINDLKDSHIVCPDLKDTLRPMINFYRKYKDDKSKHIEIN